ncbi:MAG: hypothetical protein J0L87_06060 [Bacteroidetes bacterium]|nr:hypothetical protein [Bacteroidota bacterium]
MKKIKASTLVESLVAIVLIMLSMGFATLIYINVLSSDKQLDKHRAILFLNKYALEAIAKDEMFDSEITFENYLIEKKIEKYPYSDNLYLFKLALLNMDGKEIFVRRQLILSE